MIETGPRIVRFPGGQTVPPESVAVPEAGPHVVREHPS